ncbi:MAG: hypothetical protein ACI4SI_07925, partial [Candidatus Ornithospirochaeta sp.]
MNWSARSHILEYFETDVLSLSIGAPIGPRPFAEKQKHNTGNEKGSGKPKPFIDIRYIIYLLPSPGIEPGTQGFSVLCST